MRIALALVAFGGCSPNHVVLPPLVPQTPEQRVAAFERLRPIEQGYMSISVNHGPWELASTSILLGDHVEVVHAEDLLPVIPETSACARAAHASASAASKADILQAVSWGSWISGLILLGLGLKDEPQRWHPGWIGLGVFVIGGVGGGFLERHYTRVELSERRFAFGEYTRALGEGLNVCANGLQIVACESMHQKPTPSPPPSIPVHSTQHPVAIHGW